MCLEMLKWKSGALTQLENATGTDFVVSLSLFPEAFINRWQSLIKLLSGLLMTL